MLKESEEVTMFRKMVFFSMVLLYVMLPSIAIGVSYQEQIAIKPNKNLQQIEKTKIDEKIVTGSQISGFKEINNNITTMSENITIAENERVYGNLTTVSGNIKVYGEVFGNITSATGDIYLMNSAKVRGNLTVGTGNISKEPGADLQGIEVQGEKSRSNKLVFDNNYRPIIYRESFGERIFNSFISMLGLLAVIAIILSIFPRNLQKMLGAFDIEPGRVILIGILGWLVLPFITIVSLITIIGPLILLLGAFIAVLVGTTIVSLLLGEKIKELVKWSNDNKIITAMVGLVVLWLASLLPIANIFIVITCSVVGMGVVLVTKFGIGRPWFPPRRTEVINPIVNNESMELKDINKEGSENEFHHEK